MPQRKKLCFIITWEVLGWVTKTLCTQKETNAFSLWNNNLVYQGILEYDFTQLVRGSNIVNISQLWKSLHQKRFMNRGSLKRSTITSLKVPLENGKRTDLFFFNIYETVHFVQSYLSLKMLLFHKFDHCLNLIHFFWLDKKLRSRQNFFAIFDAYEVSRLNLGIDSKVLRPKHELLFFKSSNVGIFWSNDSFCW
jgi:hypothetical protein